MKRELQSSIFLIFLIIFSGFFFACNGKKKTANNTDQIMQTDIIQPSYSLSANTKIFFSELEKEISQTKSSLESFKPSDEFVEKYDLRTREGEYFISGFIKTNYEFKRSSLEQIHITLGQVSGAITTIQVPIKSLEEFLKTEGIEFFGIAEKVNKPKTN